MTSRPFGRVLTLLALAVACGCADDTRTQVIVLLEADPEVRRMARVVDVQIYGGVRSEDAVPAEGPQEVPFPVATSDDWPVRVALAPKDGDASRLYRVVATARAGGSRLAEVRAISGYAEGRTLVLRLHFDAACLNVDPCDAPDQTCRAGECVDARVDEGSLDDYEAPPVSSTDGGVTVADGGAGGDDGGPECVSSDACDDDNPCTDDACRDGECVRTDNTANCDDGSFCNGTDTCEGGACAAHAGDPCSGDAVCDEGMATCTGCATVADCPSETVTPNGDCTYGSTCAETGTQAISIRTYTCVEAVCMAAERSDTEECTRTTEGDSCGADDVSYGTCEPDYPCAPTGSQEVTTTPKVCGGGACSNGPVDTSSETCTPPATSGCDDAGVCQPYEVDCAAVLDADCDGLFGCEDDDCYGIDGCPYPDAGMDAGGCFETYESDCADDVDNDCDGLFDCADHTDCAGDPACPGSLGDAAI